MQISEIIFVFIESQHVQYDNTQLIEYKHQEHIQPTWPSNHILCSNVAQGINIMANMPPAVVDQGLFSLNILP